MRQFILLLVLGLIGLNACKKGGEMTSPGGFPYTVHKSTGGDKPQKGDIVSFHVTERNGDKVMYSSREKGEPQKAKIMDREGMSPIEDVLKVLAVGDSVTVPFAIDTIPNLPPDMQGIKHIYYDVVVVGIQSEADFAAEQKKAEEAAQADAAIFQAREEEVSKFAQEVLSKYKGKSLGADLKSTPEGLKYVIHEEGTGKQAAAGSNVDVSYYGMLTSDGSMFDNSFSRGQPFSFPLGQGRVIQGWDIGIAMLKEGSKATLFIPAELGYGAQGSPPVIPANAELMFYVELIRVN